MKRVYVGMACTAHDPAIAVVNEDGELVYAQGAERSLQAKRGWFSLPMSTEIFRRGVLPYVSSGAQVTVASPWKLEGERFDLVQSSVHAMAQPDGLGALPPFALLLLGTLATRANSYLHLRDLLASTPHRQRMAEAPVVHALRCFDHHTTHAAYGCYSSPYTEAVCAVLDGWGEGAGSAFYLWRNGELTRLDEERTESRVSSLGYFYAYLCDACGFDPWGGEEWKVMGLAAYGRFDARIYELLAPLLQVEGLQLLGPEDPGPAWSRVRDYIGVGRPAIEYADLAHTGQKFFEDISAVLLRNLHTLGHSDNLVLGGGCALNSSWNGRVVAATGFRSLFVPAAPADDGNAAGAAWLAFREDHPAWRPSGRVQSPYLGDELQEWTLRNAIEHGGLRPASLGGTSSARRAAELLAAGKIVGWAQGRAEFGPRALGNRSILADPRNPQIKQIINSKVKFREEFRPFAPSILQERVADYFEDSQDSPYMERTLRFRADVRARVPGVVHDDGTGRLQTVTRQSNRRFYDLIAEFDRLTGVPLVLNTSFNVMGKPIIHSVEDALAVYMTTGLDALVIGDTVFEKGP